MEDQATTGAGGGKPPTSADVARLAGVSRATVSYVLNQTEGARISDETTQKVLQAATRLGYVPHKLASSLRSGQSDLILMPFFDWPYNQSSITFLQELALQLDRLGYTVMLRFFSHRDMGALAGKIAAFHPVGVIAAADELNRADVELLKRNGVQAVLAYQGAPTAYLPSITHHFTAVGECAAEYLFARGCRRIGAIVPRDERILEMGLQRLQGMEAVAGRRGMAIQRIDLGFDRAEAARLVAGWVNGPHPDAVFTYNDEYGGLLLSALVDVGIRIPDEVALLGCDNLALCEMLQPALSSIDLGPSQSAVQIADYFDRMIQGGQPEISLMLPVKYHLKIRQST